MKRKSSAPWGSRGRGQRIYDWLMRRHRRNKDALIKTLTRRIPERWQPGDCIEWQGQYGASGYGHLNCRLEVGKINTHVYAHQVFWTLANRRPIPDENEIGHTCGNKRCVNPMHLELTTRRDNLNERIERRGEKAKGA